MSEHIEKMLGAADDEIRRDATLRLKNHSSDITQEKSVSLLLRALKDSSWRVRKTAVDILVEAYPAEAYLDGLVGLLYDDDNAGARNSAIEAFVKLGPACVDTLSRAFDTDNDDVRKFVVDIAGEINHRTLIPVLIKALKDKDDNVKASAVEHLGALKESSVVDVLLDIVREGDLWTSYPAIEALGKIGDSRALPLLVDALSQKTLREPVLRALGLLDGESVVASIVPFLEDKSRAVRNEAFIAIERLYGRGVSENEICVGIENYYAERSIPMLLSNADVRRGAVRASALLLLGLMKDERAIGPLLKASLEDEYKVVALRAIVYIGKHHPTWLLKPLHDGMDPEELRKLSVALADVAALQYRDTFMALLGHSDGHVRANAARGLGNLGQEDAVAPLVSALDDKYSDVQSAVLDALIKLKYGLDVQVVESLVHNSSADIRRLSLPLLAAIGTPDAVRVIGFLMKDSSASVRKASVESLASLMNADSERLLIHALTDENDDVRSFVALRLGETRDLRFLDPLVLLLSDADGMVRVAACKGLGMLGDKAAIRHLVALMDDENGFVVAASMEAMARIGGLDARDNIIRMLNSDDREIRRTAIRCLRGFEGVQEHVLPFLNSGDWATRYEVAVYLRPVSDKAVMKLVQDAYIKENDQAVRSALKELIDE